MDRDAHPGCTETCAPDDSAARPLVDLPGLSLTWESDFSLTANQAMSGRLRAGIVLGLRLHRGSGVREVVVRRILLRLHARI